MLRRCENPAHWSFKHYGGRGITVCERWHALEHFIADMGQPPDGMTLDRIDNDKGYEPGNCKWATRREQRRNSRQALTLLELNGVVMAVVDWSRTLGIGHTTILMRLKRGWTNEEALTGSRAP
jgi:hypothetical protein